MKKTITILLFSSYLISLNASDTLLLEDNFTNRSVFTDNSLLVLWGSNITSQTCFNLTSKKDTNNLTYSCLSLNSPNSFLYKYNSDTGLKTLSSIDYNLGNVNRANCTIKIEFDVLWELYSNWGEGGRLVVTLVDDYPGATLNQVNDTNLVHPFGRPRYNLRIRNTKYYATSYSQYNQTSTTFMLYGGGLDEEGEWEKFPDGPWWLPGFSSEPGGESPGQPGNLDFPVDETKKSDYPYAMVARIHNWKHVTWVIEPEMLKLYHRPSYKTAIYDTLVSFMSIPKDSFGTSYIVNKMNSDHGTAITNPPTMYKWFPEFETVRFYFSGSVQNYLSNVKITKTTPDIVNTPELLSEKTLKIFPNPIKNGYFYIDGFSDEDNKLTIYDITGKKCLEVDIAGQTSPLFVDVAGLQEGMYLVKISSDTETRTLLIMNYEL